MVKLLICTELLLVLILVDFNFIYNMIKKIVLLVCILALPTISFSQEKIEIIEIQFQAYSPDILVVYNSLNSIEISGNEVDAFVRIQTKLEPFVKSISQEDLRNSVLIDITLVLPDANNLLAFLNRVKIKGAEAQNFKRFKDSLFASVKSKIEELQN